MRLTGEQIAEFKEKGFPVLPDLFPADVRTAIKADLPRQDLSACGRWRMTT